MRVNPQIPKTAGRYGAVASGLTIVAFLVFYYLGQQPWRNLISLILDTLLVGVFSFLAIKDFKSNVNAGVLRFYHGMTLGFITYMTIASVFALFYWAFIEVIVPDFLAHYIALAKEDMIARKDLITQALGEESYLEQLKLLDETTPGVLVLDAFIKKLLIGLVLVPIFSVVLRN